MFFQIHAQRPEDAPLLEPLLDRTFGTDRFQRTVYRLREGLDPAEGLCFAALDAEGRLLGSLRFWPVLVGGRRAILLGPLAVEPALQGRGIGRALVRHGLAEARRLGERLCLVVGEPEYYEPFGFVNAIAHGFALPGPVDPRRFQVLAFDEDALEGPGGLVRRWDLDEQAPTPATRPRGARRRG